MNYLAHAYLSFNDPDILVGNMISDFVKGKTKFDYSPAIQRGIALHRAIDEFTDHHPATAAAKEYFRKDYRLYSGAFVDVVYDHFLANDPKQFINGAALATFCQHTYEILQQKKAQLHPRFLQMLPYMQQQNWLYNYRFRSGIEKSFGGVVRRAAYLSEFALAYQTFNDRHEQLGECYRQFFPSLKEFTLQYLRSLSAG